MSDSTLSLDEDGHVREDGPPDKGRFRCTFISIEPWLLELRAAEILITAAKKHDSIDELEVQDWFKGKDMNFHSLWVQGGEVFALTEPELVGRFVVREDQCCLVMHNPFGAVQVVTSEETARKIMES